MLYCPEAESGRARAVVAALRGQRCLCVMLSGAGTLVELDALLYWVELCGRAMRELGHDS